MAALCPGSGEGILEKTFLRSRLPPNLSREPSVCGANPVRILHLRGACFAPSLHSPSNTCCGGWKPRVIVQDPELWPPASAPTLNPHFSWGCSAGWHRALEFPSPLGSRIPSQQLPTPFGVSSLCSPSGALGVRKFKCNFAFLLSWYSVAGGVSEKGWEASWSEM